jgi:hypothetical protein
MYLSAYDGELSEQSHDNIARICDQKIDCRAR